MKPPLTVEARVAEDLRNWLASELEQLDASNTNQFAHHVVTILLHEDLDIEDEPLTAGDDFLQNIYNIKKGKTRDRQKKAAVQFLRSAVCCNDSDEAEIQGVVDELMVKIDETKSKMNKKSSKRSLLAPIAVNVKSAVAQASNKQDGLEQERRYNEAFPSLASEESLSKEGAPRFNVDSVWNRSPPAGKENSKKRVKKKPVQFLNRQCYMFTCQEEAQACSIARQVAALALAETSLPNAEAAEVFPSTLQDSSPSSFSDNSGCWKSAFRTVVLTKVFSPTVAPLQSKDKFLVPYADTVYKVFSPNVVSKFNLNSSDLALSVKKATSEDQAYSNSRHFHPIPDGSGQHLYSECLLDEDETLDSKKADNEICAIFEAGILEEQQLRQKVQNVVQNKVQKVKKPKVTTPYQKIPSEDDLEHALQFPCHCGDFWQDIVHKGGIALYPDLHVKDITLNATDGLKPATLLNGGIEQYADLHEEKIMSETDGLVKCTIDTPLRSVSTSIEQFNGSSQNSNLHWKDNTMNEIGGVAEWALGAQVSLPTAPVGKEISDLSLLSLKSLRETYSLQVIKNLVVNYVSSVSCEQRSTGHILKGMVDTLIKRKEYTLLLVKGNMNDKKIKESLDVDQVLEVCIETLTNILSPEATEMVWFDEAHSLSESDRSDKQASDNHNVEKYWQEENVQFSVNYILESIDKSNHIDSASELKIAGSNNLLTLCSTGPGLNSACIDLENIPVEDLVSGIPSLNGFSPSFLDNVDLTYLDDMENRSIHGSDCRPRRTPMTFREDALTWEGKTEKIDLSDGWPPDSDIHSKMGLAAQSKEWHIASGCYLAPLQPVETTGLEVYDQQDIGYFSNDMRQVQWDNPWPLTEWDHICKEYLGGFMVGTPAWPQRASPPNPYRPSLLTSCLSKEGAQFLESAFVNSYFSNDFTEPHSNLKRTAHAVDCSALEKLWLSRRNNSLERFWLAKDSQHSIAVGWNSSFALIEGVTCSNWLENNCNLGHSCPFSHPSI
uniref:C3H1-type domain-containing protein n=1 Tax=Biomphalaria glabrata TaxID=6526 RepID=A0A2C9M373_BIOGL